MRELGSGAEACLMAGAPMATLMFILDSSKLLSLYYVGSRRGANDRGSRALYQFLSRYFPRFNRSARDSSGRLLQVRIPLLRQGGKAFKRLKISSALIALFHRGVLEELVAPSTSETRCVLTSIGRWGFQINVPIFHEDFQEAIAAYEKDVNSDECIQQCYTRRFNHLYGWDLPAGIIVP
jgi:hypothetical protein